MICQPCPPDPVVPSQTSISFVPSLSISRYITSVQSTRRISFRYGSYTAAHSCGNRSNLTSVPGIHAGDNAAATTAAASKLSILKSLSCFSSMIFHRLEMYSSLFPLIIAGFMPKEAREHHDFLPNLCSKKSPRRSNFDTLKKVTASDNGIFLLPIDLACKLLYFVLKNMKNEKKLLPRDDFSLKKSVDSAVKA